jgi:hypothetical protein
LLDERQIADVPEVGSSIQISLPAASNKLMSVHSFHGGDDSMTENPIARMWVVSRVERICAGANEIMKEVTGSSR